MDLLDKRFKKRIGEASQAPVVKAIQSLVLTSLNLAKECPVIRQYVNMERERGDKLTFFGNAAAGAALASIVAMDRFKDIRYASAAALGGALGAGAVGYYNQEANVVNAMKGLKEFASSHLIKIAFGLNISDKNHQIYLPAGTKKVENLESLLHLRYWCFFAMLVYETPNTVEGILKTRNMDYSGSKVIEGVLEKVVSRETELIHFNNLTHDIAKPEFFIFVDHLSSTIVISVRGTFSAQDAVSDIIGDLSKTEMNPLTLSGEAPGAFLAHSGFYKAALDVLNKGRPFVYDFASKYPDYDIKVVGHSYGAGISSIVAWGLEEDRINKVLKTNRSVRGLLYCCPPVFNLYAAESCCYFLVSIVMGWDCVPSASANNVFKFTCSNTEIGDNDNSESIYQKCANDDNPYVKSLYCSCYVPGTIYWMTYDEVTQEVDALNIIYRSNDRLQNLIIHENMVEDHFSTKIYTYLLALIIKEERKIERNREMEARFRQKRELGSVELDKRSDLFGELVRLRREFDQEEDKVRKVDLKYRIQNLERQLERETGTKKRK